MADFDEAFGRFYKPVGRAAKPTRLMVGLHYLKHTYDLSDEETVERWVENPYWQYFCGFEFFQHAPPIDPSLMTRWRQRVGPEEMDRVLKATVEMALASDTVKPSSLERVTVDTTVQEKAIAHPTDSRLYLKALQALVRQAKKAGLALRQSHTRLAKKAAAKAGRYAHAKQYRRMRRELKRLRTYLGRVYRDVGRKIAGDGEREARFARLLGLVERLLAQQPKDKNKLYSLHAPEVVCIAKGKAHKRYEFGCKVGIAATNREGLFLAAKAFEDNPYDGHTLQATIDQAEAMSGVAHRARLRRQGLQGPRLPGPRHGHALRAKTRPHAPNETRTQATIGHRADDRPRQERRQAWQELSARSRWRQDQRAPGRSRPQPAPHPQQVEASFCLFPGCPLRRRRKNQYLAAMSQPPEINRLAVFQGGLSTISGITSRFW